MPVGDLVVESRDDSTDFNDPGTDVPADGLAAVHDPQLLLGPTGYFRYHAQIAAAILA